MQKISLILKKISLILKIIYKKTNSLKYFYETLKFIKSFIVYQNERFVRQNILIVSPPSLSPC